MMANLEQIRIEGQKHAQATKRVKSCQGSEVRGHFRTINGDKIWIEPFDRMAHQRQYNR